MATTSTQARGPAGEFKAPHPPPDRTCANDGGLAFHTALVTPRTSGPEATPPAATLSSHGYARPAGVAQPTPPGSRRRLPGGGFARPGPAAAKTPSMASSLRGVPTSGPAGVGGDGRSRRTLFQSSSSVLARSRVPVRGAVPPSTPAAQAYGGPAEPPAAPAATPGVRRIEQHLHELKISQRAPSPVAAAPTTRLPPEQLARIRQMLVKFRSNHVFLDGMPRAQRTAIAREVSRYGATAATEFFDGRVTLVVTAGREDSVLASVYCNKEMFARKPGAPFAEILRAALPKQQEHAVKVWELAKLERLFEFFHEYYQAAEVRAGATPATPARPEADLMQLLTQEKFAGLPTTTHRKTAGVDWHEFQNPYLLVEDAQNNHKPIVVREFEYKAKYGAACIDTLAPEPRPTPWPRIYYDAGPERCPFHLYLPPEGTPAAPRPPGIRRPLRRRGGVGGPRGPGGSAAAARGDGPAAAVAAGTDASAALGDPNASGLHTMSTAQSTTARHLRRSHMQRRKEAALSGLKVMELPGRRAAAADGKASAAPENPQDDARGGKRRLLESWAVASDAPPASLPTTAEERYQLRSQALIVYQKPGWCENCVEKYTNFLEHVQTRKHRHYATNAQNFVHLDNILRPLARPLRPAGAPAFPPVKSDELVPPPDNDGHSESFACYDNTSGDDFDLDWIRQHPVPSSDEDEDDEPLEEPLSLPSDELDEQLAAAAGVLGAPGVQTSDDGADGPPADYTPRISRYPLGARVETVGGQDQNQAPGGYATAAVAPRIARTRTRDCMRSDDGDWDAMETHTLYERVKRMKRLSHGGDHPAPA